MRKLDMVTAAIRYIEAHLTENLNLDTVAAAVHYSRHHLHRVFTEVVGISIHDYVQRRQLTEAAKLLVFSRRPILDIALIARDEHSLSLPKDHSGGLQPDRQPLPALSIGGLSPDLS